MKTKTVTIFGRLFILATTFYSLLLLVACASISPKNMIPEMGKPTITFRNTAISVGTIYAGEIKTREASRDLTGGDELTPAQFSEALYSSLEKSGMFKEVKSNRNQGLIVEADLVSQEVRSGFPATVLILVHYRLLNGEKTVWKKSFFSAKDTIHAEGVEQRARAMERAVKNNIKQFLTALPTALEAM